MKTLLVALSLGAAALAAQAQAVWRCGADARDYSTTPCAEGRTVAVADARSPDQAASARQVLARDKQLARDLAAQRHELEREQAVRGSGLIAIKRAIKPVDKPAPKLDTKAPKRPSKERAKPLGAGDTWTSTAPASRRTRG